MMALESLTAVPNQEGAFEPPALHRERAYRQIRDLVIRGELSAKEPVSERRLSEKLGLGRTPVREALRSLTAEGLFRIVPMQGTFVRTLSFEDLREIHEMRVALEGMAAFLAARNGPTPAMIECAARLKDIRRRKRVDSDLNQRTGWEFHAQLFEAAGNSRLSAAYETLRAQNGLALGKLDNYDAQRSRQAVNEHLQIFEAVQARNPVAAQESMRDHLSGAFLARLQALGQGPSGTPVADASPSRLARVKAGRG